MFSSTLRTALIALTYAAAVANAATLSLKVSGPQAVDSVEDLKVVATLTNNGAEAVKILNDPRGALSKMPTDTFSITDAAGSVPSFSGVKVKYVPEHAAKIGAYTTLKPGESIEVEHHLGHAYNFTLPGAGAYDIHANNRFYIVNPDSSLSTVYADSAAHSARLSGKGKLAIARETPAGILSKRYTYKSCSSSQQSSIVSAAAGAETYAANAYSYLNSHTSSTTRYTTWFGTYTSARHSTVTSHFQKIDSNTFSTFTFDCSCTDSGTYAYVYPDTFGYIYLCGAFWQAPTTGTDSKAGTIIHESSHFTSNGGTDDHVYGQTAAKSLAKSDPASAIDNADNHEYFAENNPSLS
ncbi:hypothetical protein D9613_009121 [Agrocybe pediades]|uniref:Lysine-specific metallo-endopeptidase domain-containing protein n=1 Tax=Agrocybe pediades TaxID=84607 RepID=A0A8H4R370_9AGAR|nr:hypothetical protein D9613_009121 [Agrocybe pediades]